MDDIAQFQDIFDTLFTGLDKVLRSSANEWRDTADKLQYYRDHDLAVYSSNPDWLNELGHFKSLESARVCFNKAFDKYEAIVFDCAYLEEQRELGTVADESASLKILIEGSLDCYAWVAAGESAMAKTREQMASLWPSEQ